MKFPSPYPTPQGSNYRGPGVNAGLSQLRNPFDGGQGQEPVHRHSEPSTGPASPVYPSPQGPNYYGMGGHAMLGQLRNPFDGGAGQDKRGRFEYASPQYSTGAVLGGGRAVLLSPGAPGATTPGATTAAANDAGRGGPRNHATGGRCRGRNRRGRAGCRGANGSRLRRSSRSGRHTFCHDWRHEPDQHRRLEDEREDPRTPGPPLRPCAEASPVYAAARNVKISENQSPRPQDRIYFNFNYYNNVNSTINRRDLSPVTQMKAYTYLFGIEKTFNDGKGSIGIRVPLDNLTANSNPNVLSTPTSTAAGNLSIIAKYILEQNVKTGSLISAGFAITVPTGPSRFAGAPYLFPLNSVYFQPYIGYIYNHDRWYIQGFSGFNFTSNVNDCPLHSPTTSASAITCSATTIRTHS